MSIYSLNSKLFVARLARELRLRRKLYCYFTTASGTGEATLFIFARGFGYNYSL